MQRWGAMLVGLMVLVGASGVRADMNMNQTCAKSASEAERLGLNCWIEENGAVHTQYTATSPRTFCEAKMEAAMRAVAPYLNFWTEGGIILHSPYKAAPVEALKLWQSVKEECWYDGPR
jgi:hypothetical protein